MPDDGYAGGRAVSLRWSGIAHDAEGHQFGLGMDGVRGTNSKGRVDLAARYKWTCINKYGVAERLLLHNSHLRITSNAMRSMNRVVVIMLAIH